MEQQKVLWIIFSVALFVLVIVSVSVIWFLPEETGVSKAETAGSTRGTAGTGPAYDPVQWVRGTESVPELEPDGSEEDDGIFIVYGDAETEAAAEPKETVTPPPAADTASGETGGSRPAVVPSGAESPTAPAAPSRTPSAAAPTSAPTAAPVVRSAAPAAPKAVKVTEYWIQAGSYRTKSRAQDAQAALKERSVSSRITTKEIEGDTFYRVRIGPYENREEAQKFLISVKNIKSFEGSYISQVSVQRTAN